MAPVRIATMAPVRIATPIGTHGSAAGIPAKIPENGHPAIMCHMSQGLKRDSCTIPATPRSMIMHVILGVRCRSKGGSAVQVSGSWQTALKPSTINGSIYGCSYVHQLSGNDPRTGRCKAS